MPRISNATIFEKMARRRGQKKGHLYQKSGNWLGRYYVDSTELDEKGNPRRDRITVTVAACKGPEAIGKREAQRIFEQEYLAQVNAGNMRPSSAKSLESFVTARFMPDYLPTLKLSGQIHYRTMLRTHILPSLGSVKLRDITVERVQSVLTSKGRSGLSTQTVVHIRNCLSAVLRHAKAMGWFFGELPTVGVRLPEMKREARQAPTWEQVCMLSNALPDPCATLVIFLALTGLRIGEASGLRWEHVNLTDKPKPMGTEMLAPYSLAVRENWVRNQRQTLKTSSSTRNVPIPVWFVTRLALLQRGDAMDLQGSPVFANASGLAPIDQHNLARRVLKPAATKLGMPWISWHCFRHANATLANQAGISVIEAQKMLGHATSEMTLHYSHADLERLRDRMESMADSKLIAPNLDTNRTPELSNLIVSSGFVN